ncbi:autotransporter outer membrane beta-barrel domain-containing protein [Prosthecodimorpha staleyi]|uniref:Autotransporter domain-containing protein n=1 Tax=Prosthecodimorpha staleyi TaxID=2840188 RepID=A0A947GDB8_9HYPH|nr:autotransporter outer membrane beta-barrel domain-containing protein [Prosthecodimorpha staleyi]MBT9290687.1 autotransporter domain-containing protein [Prosthecodimorpha staleyi]
MNSRSRRFEPVALSGRNRGLLPLATASMALALSAVGAEAGCTIDNATVGSCDSSGVTVTAGFGSSTLTVDGVNSIGIFYSPPPNTPSGTFTQTLTVTGGSVLDSTGGQSGVNGGSGISMVSTGSGNNANVTQNSTAIIEAGVVIDSHARYGGAVFLRSEGAGDVVIDNSGMVTAVGIHDDNTPFTNAEVEDGAVVDGLTATTHLGAATVINRGSVTAMSGRGLYADGNFAAATVDNNGYVTAINAPMQTSSIRNMAGATVEAQLAGARAIAYYGLASVDNAGTVHSVTRQALVAWSKAGDAIVVNSGTATADDRNAVQAATERGNATIINSGIVSASMAPTDTLGADYGYSGLRANVDFAGTVTIVNSGTVTAAYDAAVVAHTPSVDATVTNSGTLNGLSGVFISNGAGQGTIDTINDTAADTVGSNTIAGTARLVNSGSIAAVNYGAYLDATHTVVKNSGSITASIGTGVVTNATVSAVVDNSGTISGEAYGVDAYSATTVTNRGTISGSAGAAVRFNANGNRLNVYDGSAFEGGIAFQNTTGNRISFYTGSYTLAVQDYLLDQNTIKLRGSARTLITSGLNGAGTGDILVVDTSGSTAVDRSAAVMQNQVSGVLRDIMDLDTERGAAVLPPAGSGGALGYAAEGKPAASPTLRVFNDGRGQSVAVDPAGTLFWMRGFYGTRDQSADGAAAGSDAHQYGTLAGADRVYEDWRIGAFGGAGRTSNTLSDGSASLDADMALAGLYARRSFGMLAFDASLTGGYVWADAERRIGGGDVAKGSFDGRFISPELALSAKYALAPNWTLRPSLGIRYVATQFDGYTESGSSQNVRYDSRSSQSLEERFDARLGYRIDTGAGQPSTVWIGGGATATQWFDKGGYGASVSGADFTVKPVGDKTVYGGSLAVGFDLKLSGSASLFGSFEHAQFTDRSRTDVARGGFKVAF